MFPAKKRRPKISARAKEFRVAAVWVAEMLGRAEMLPGGGLSLRSFTRAFGYACTFATANCLLKTPYYLIKNQLYDTAQQCRKYNLATNLFLLPNKFGVKLYFSP
jgi:hypothetical protein